MRSAKAWTPQEEQLLVELYGGATKGQQLLARFPGRTLRSLNMKAFKLGLTRPAGMPAIGRGRRKKCRRFGWHRHRLSDFE